MASNNSKRSKPVTPSASLGELMQSAPLPDWIQDMKKHYRQTGTTRPQDIHRLLGNPNKRVEVLPNASIISLFTKTQQD